MANGTLALGLNNALLNAATNITVSGAITTGTGGTLAKNGAGTVTLSGAGNNFTGATAVNAGTLAFTVADALGTSAGGTTVTSATLSLVGAAGLTVTGETLTLSTATLAANAQPNIWTGNITLLGTSSVSVAAASTLTLSGVIDGGGSLAQVDRATSSPPDPTARN